MLENFLNAQHSSGLLLEQTVGLIQSTEVSQLFWELVAGLVASTLIFGGYEVWQYLALLQNHVVALEHKTSSSQSEIENLEKIEDYSKNYEWFIKISRLLSGASFGELALINDQPRAATIQCLSDVNVAVLSKNDYQRVFSRGE